MTYDSFYEPSPASPRAGGPVRPSSYEIPSLTFRIVVGAILFVVMVVALTYVPSTLHVVPGVSISDPFTAVLLSLGVLVALASAVKYISKPTRWYGPITMGASLLGIVYLAVLLSNPTLTISTRQSGAFLSITAGYAPVLWGLLIVPVATFAAGLLTTVEDARDPEERLPHDFPVPRP